MDKHKIGQGITGSMTQVRAGRYTIHTKMSRYELNKKIVHACKELQKYAKDAEFTRFLDIIEEKAKRDAEGTIYAQLLQGGAKAMAHFLFEWRRSTLGDDAALFNHQCTPAMPCYDFCWRRENEDVRAIRITRHDMPTVFCEGRILEWLLSLDELNKEDEDNE